MRVLSRDAKEKKIKLLPEGIEDLWYLSRVIEPGDHVIGRSTRRFRVEGLRAETGEKKPVKIKLLVEKVEFAEAANKLRATGKIVAGEPEEFVSLGEHHTLDVEPYEAIAVVKELNAYHEHLLKEAVERSREAKVGIIAIDDEKATFATLSTRGVEFSVEVRCHAEKRFPEKYEQQMREFFGEVASAANRIEGAVIVAGPGFVKENFKKFVEEKQPKLAEKLLLEDASSAERSAVYELLKRGALKRAMGRQKLQEEFLALEKLKASLAREDGLACYGSGKVRQAVEANAVSEILVLDEEIRRREASDLVEEARKKGASILIFDSMDAAGEEFKTYEIAALLRFRLW